MTIAQPLELNSASSKINFADYQDVLSKELIKILKNNNFQALLQREFVSITGESHASIKAIDIIAELFRAFPRKMQREKNSKTILNALAQKPDNLKKSLIISQLPDNLRTINVLTALLNSKKSYHVLSNAIRVLGQSIHYFDSKSFRRFLKVNNLVDAAYIFKKEQERLENNEQRDQHRDWFVSFLARVPTQRDKVLEFKKVLEKHRPTTSSNVHLISPEDLILTHGKKFTLILQEDFKEIMKHFAPIKYHLEVREADFPLFYTHNGFKLLLSTGHFLTAALFFARHKQYLQSDELIDAFVQTGSRVLIIALIFDKLEEHLKTPANILLLAKYLEQNEKKRHKDQFQQVFAHLREKNITLTQENFEAIVKSADMAKVCAQLLDKRSITAKNKEPLAQRLLGNKTAEDVLFFSDFVNKNKLRTYYRKNNSEVQAKNEEKTATLAALSPLNKTCVREIYAFVQPGLIDTKWEKKLL